MKAFFLPLGLGLALIAPPATAQSLSGQADVVDGDTLAFRGEKTRVRLYGVDAPEGQQTCDDAERKRYLCGSKAADALASLIGRSGQVACREEDRDRYGRVVAVCHANGRDINGELIRQGWAIEYNQYSDGRYSDEETEARQAKRGLWAGTFVKPWDWRRGERLPSEALGTAKAAERKCGIKGNISGSGRIYHVPGSRRYEDTQVNEASGERWFCSEDQAKGAGWRAPRG